MLLLFYPAVPAQIIHISLKKESCRFGSMENALCHVEGRFISRRNFVHGVLNEFFRLNTPTLDIEKHLHLFYDTFQGSTKDRVDWHEVLCTYLSVAWKHLVLDNPRRLFYKYVDIYSDSSNVVFVKDTFNIITIGAVTEGDFVQSSGKLKQCCVKEKYEDRQCVSRKQLDDLFDTTPSLLLQFKDQIIAKINTKDRLLLLSNGEVNQ